jgi:hypothetical protein
MTGSMNLLSAVFCSDSVDAVKESEEKTARNNENIDQTLNFSQSGVNRV